MRTAEITRRTKETDVRVALALDGGPVAASTGIGFFDHMLHAFAVHGGFGLTVDARGDLEVDGHHTVEDVGIVLGQAFAAALDGGAGIARFGSFFVPMDEALAFAAVDCSGRPFLAFQAEFPQANAGGYDCCLTEEFFRAFATHAGVTLHLRALHGKNSHHIVEALFKAAGHAMRLAVTPNASGAALSTKGSLDGAPGKRGDAG